MTWRWASTEKSCCL